MRLKNSAYLKRAKEKAQIGGATSSIQKLVGAGIAIVVFGIIVGNTLGTGLDPLTTLANDTGYPANVQNLLDLMPLFTVLVLIVALAGVLMDLF